MSTVTAPRTDFYHVPLPVVLTASMHGEMKYFELGTVRLTDSDGAEGMGYTYTVCAGGGGIHSMIVRDLTPRLINQPAENIEALWQKMWWTLHGGRGRQATFAISAIDIAVGSQGEDCDPTTLTVVEGSNPSPATNKSRACSDAGPSSFRPVPHLCR